IVLRQPPIPPEPAERPLHDPSPPHRLELGLARPLARRLQMPPAMLLDPPRQGDSPVRLIGERLGQPGEPLPDPPEPLTPPVPIRGGGRQDGQAPDQPQGVAEPVPLAAGDLFSPRRAPSGRRPRWS